MLNLIRKYGGMFAFAVFISTVGMFGIQEQAATRLCDPVPRPALWVTLGMIALITTAIMLYVVGTEETPRKPETIFGRG